MFSARPSEARKQWDNVLNQAEFAYNSMTNWSTYACPFNIVYTKDIAVLPKCHNSEAHKLAESFKDTLEEVRNKLEQSNMSYKLKADVHRRPKLFHPSELVMVRLRKERFPTGSYSKLSPRKIRLVVIKQKVNDNAYVIDFPSDILTLPTFNIANISPYHPTDSTPTSISSSDSTSSEAGENWCGHTLFFTLYRHKLPPILLPTTSITNYSTIACDTISFLFSFVSTVLANEV